MHTTTVVEQHTHRARVDTIVALGRDDYLEVDPEDGVAVAIAEALELMGIRPPARLAAPGAAVEPLVSYAIELVEALDRIADYDVDPAGTYEDEHDVTHLNGSMVTAGQATADRLREEYDALIEESR